VLVLRSLDPTHFAPLFLDGLPPPGWADLCRRGGLLVFAAEDEDGELAGFTVARSGPRLVRVLELDGESDACRLLLRQLVRLAGERGVGGWFSGRRPDLYGVLEDLGFRRTRRGRSGFLYRLWCGRT
jgi:hypothetical protein